MKWTLRALTTGALVGVYMFNTNDVGEYIDAYFDSIRSLHFFMLIMGGEESTLIMDNERFSPLLFTLPFFP